MIALEAIHKEVPSIVKKVKAQKKDIRVEIQEHTLVAKQILLERTSPNLSKKSLT